MVQTKKRLWKQVSMKIVADVIFVFERLVRDNEWELRKEEYICIVEWKRLDEIVENSSVILDFPTLGRNFNENFEPKDENINRDSRNRSGERDIVMSRCEIRVQPNEGPRPGRISSGVSTLREEGAERVPRDQREWTRAFEAHNEK